MHGQLRANGTAIAHATLRRQGIIVTHLRKERFKHLRQLKDKDITLLTRQLATILKAGMTLLQAFTIIASAAGKPALTNLVLQLRTDLESGASLQQALRRHPRYFNPLFCSLVAAGEQSGMLADILDKLATNKEKAWAIQHKLRSVMLYPLTVILFAGIITCAIMLWVVPTFQQIFHNAGAELPVPTLALIAISTFLRQYGGALLAIGVLLMLLLRKAWHRSTTLRASADMLILRLPLLGNLIRNSVLARWSRTLATLCDAGIPLDSGLNAVAAIASNTVYTHATHVVHAAVSNGISLTAAMTTTRRFPELMTQMIATGEESGTLAPMLTRIAEFYEMEVNDTIATISTLAEPFIMAILGLFIGSLVIALYLPIFKLGVMV